LYEGNGVIAAGRAAAPLCYSAEGVTMQPLSRLLLDFTRDGVCRYTFDEGRILLANQAFVDALDLDCRPGELVGKCLKDLLTCVERAGTVREALEKTGEIHGFEYHFKTLKGEDGRVPKVGGN
jgi:PAS domain-containing protein